MIKNDKNETLDRKDTKLFYRIDIVKFIKKFLWNVTFIVLIWLGVGIYFENFKTIYF